MEKMDGIAENYSSIRNAENKVRDAFSEASRIPEMFHNCIADTLKKTIKVTDRGDVFVITGDIPAMWLRDSACQLHLFTKFADREPKLREIIEGVIARQVDCILVDPYANAFNEKAGTSIWASDITDMKPELWERKYEIDSLCYPLQLSYLYYKKTGRREIFTDKWKAAAQLIIRTFRIEQYHESRSDYYFIRNNCVFTDTLSRNGKGALVKDGTGLIFSGFRPSDDACMYGYLIPSNMFASVCLGYISEIAQDVYGDEALASEAKNFSLEVRKAIEQYGVVPGREEEFYAYEVDGYGQYLIMDDANVPSLLAMPYFGYCTADSPRYIATKKIILSDENPYYYSGRYLRGIGSPHTPAGRVWDIALAVQGLVSTDREEKRALIDMMERSDAGTFMMHESIDANNPNLYTRPWFSWANSMFCELVMDYCGIL